MGSFYYIYSPLSRSFFLSQESTLAYCQLQATVVAEQRAPVHPQGPSHRPALAIAVFRLSQDAGVVVWVCVRLIVGAISPLPTHEQSITQTRHRHSLYAHVPRHEAVVFHAQGVVGVLGR